MAVYRECPNCGAEKAFSLEGTREWDTNVGPSLEVDERWSCSCDLTAEQWEELRDTITDEDFIPDYD